MKENKIRPKDKFSFKTCWKYIVLAVLLVLVDRVSKALSIKYLTEGLPVWVIKDFAGFYLVFNEGAAWSIGAGQRFLLSGISILACILIAIYFILVKQNKGERLGLVFIFAGALGNGIDRVLTGKVTDMLYCNIFIMFNSEFPIFNIADLFVTAGAIILMINWIFLDKDFEEHKGE